MDPQSPMMQLFPLILMFLVFYVLVMRPHKKEQEQHKKRLAALQKNDRVVTTGGIHGTVVNVKETTIILRVDDNVKLEFDKDAIKVIKD
ncbi:MAG: preprotein translocase subunit YajC [Candidatus Omnitrophota bacterium]